MVCKYYVKDYRDTALFLPLSSAIYRAPSALFIKLFFKFHKLLTRFHIINLLKAIAMKIKTKTKN